jgi:hypothetical protein
MKKVKCSYLDDDDEEEDYKNIAIEVEVEELPAKVKYKTILEEEDDFLPE